MWIEALLNPLLIQSVSRPTNNRDWEQVCSSAQSRITERVFALLTELITKDKLAAVIFIWIRCDGGLTLETSALESLYGGQ